VRISASEVIVAEASSIDGAEAELYRVNPGAPRALPVRRIEEEKR